MVNSDLAAQVDALAGRLADTTPEDCGALLDEFTLSSGASAMLVGPDGELVDTGASLTVQAVYEDERVAVTTAEGGHGGQLWDGDGNRGNHDHHRL